MYGIYQIIKTPQFGIVKSLNDLMSDHAFVVYNCNGEWEHYADYTAVNTKIKDLMPADVVILKIQQSLNTTAEEQQVLFYDENRKINYQTPITDKLKKLLGNKPKSFWYAVLVDGTNVENTSKLALLNKAPWQKW